MSPSANVGPVAEAAASSPQPPVRSARLRPPHEGSTDSWRFPDCQPTLSATTRAAPRTPASSPASLEAVTTTGVPGGDSRRITWLARRMHPPATPASLIRTRLRVRPGQDEHQERQAGDARERSDDRDGARPLA